MSRIALFADVQNLYYTVRQGYGCHFNYAALWATLETQGEIVEAYAYAIDRGDADVGITIDVLDAASRVDHVVLASGDGDFDLLLERIRRSNGVRTTVYGVPGLTAQSLIRATDVFRPIEGALLLRH